jgi:hypothetical protein
MPFIINCSNIDNIVSDLNVIIICDLRKCYRTLDYYKLNATERNNLKYYLVIRKTKKKSITLREVIYYMINDKNYQIESSKSKYIYFQGLKQCSDDKMLFFAIFSKQFE